jgi:hypothetical protein
LIIIMFLSNLNIPRPSRLTIRFLSLILILPLPKSFLTPKRLIPQFSKYYTLLRFSIYISPSVSITQISVLLPKPSGLASLLAVSIAGKNAGVYMPALRLSIDLTIYVSAPVSNSVLSYLISNRFFLFRCAQK